MHIYDDDKHKRLVSRGNVTRELETSSLREYISPRRYLSRISFFRLFSSARICNRSRDNAVEIWMSTTSTLVRHGNDRVAGKTKHGLGEENRRRLRARGASDVPTGEWIARDGDPARASGVY